MSRLRFNDCSSFGTTNPITLASGTTNACSWSSSPGFGLISPPDLAAIIVEPDTANEEIIWLFGFVPGATTGLVIRNAEVSQSGAGAITHTAVAWVHGPTAQDWHVTRAANAVNKMAFR